MYLLLNARRNKANVKRNGDAVHGKTLKIHNANNDLEDAGGVETAINPVDAPRTPSVKIRQLPLNNQDVKNPVDGGEKDRVQGNLPANRATNLDLDLDAKDLGEEEGAPNNLQLQLQYQHLSARHLSPLHLPPHQLQ